MPGLVTSSATGNPAGGTPAPRLNLKFSRPFGPRCGWGAKPGVETPGYSRVVPVGTKWPGDKSAHIPACSPGRERLEIFSRIAPMKLCGRAFGVADRSALLNEVPRLRDRLVQKRRLAAALPRRGPHRTRNRRATIKRRSATQTLAPGFPRRRPASPWLIVALEFMEPCCCVTISPDARGKARVKLGARREGRILTLPPNRSAGL